VRAVVSNTVSLVMVGGSYGFFVVIVALLVPDRSASPTP